MKCFFLFFYFTKEFGRAASRGFASLASGYPLHHPRRASRLRVVPLLSLSLKRIKQGAPHTRQVKNFLYINY